MPLHAQSFGAVVAEVTAQPNMDVGVVFAGDGAVGWGGGVALALCTGGGGEGGG